MRPLPVRALPGMPPFVLGIATIRGHGTPVLDTRLLMGAPPDHPPGRFVTLRIEERTVALAVDSVLDVRPLDRAELSELPPLLEAGAADLIAELGIVDAELLVVLRTSRLVPDVVWTTVAQREDA